MVPNNPSLSYISLVFLFLGIFLLLNYFSIINFESIKVSQTKKTKYISLGLIFLSIILFIFSFFTEGATNKTPSQPPKLFEEAYNQHYTYKRKGLFSVDKNWKGGWLEYLTIYKDFVQLPTKKGYYILSSPHKHSIFSAKTENFIEVAGYLRTNNGIFYITKYSYDHRNEKDHPKFIVPIN